MGLSEKFEVELTQSVPFRNHPPLDQALTESDSDSDSDSDGVTDEEHVLTLGENLSPNSYSKHLLVNKTTRQSATL